MATFGKLLINYCKVKVRFVPIESHKIKNIGHKALTDVEPCAYFNKQTKIFGEPSVCCQISNLVNFLCASKLLFKFLDPILATGQPGVL